MFELIVTVDLVRTLNLVTKYSRLSKRERMLSKNDVNHTMILPIQLPGYDNIARLLMASRFY